MDDAEVAKLFDPLFADLRENVAPSLQSDLYWRITRRSRF
jgi:hypothetical protein